MIQEATTSPAIKPSLKCLNCGLVNFAVEEKCKRCGADLSVKPAQRDGSAQMKGVSPKRTVFKAKSFMICAVALVLLVSLGALYIVKSPHAAPEQARQSQVSEASATNVEPEQQEDSSQQVAQKKEAAARLTKQLARIQEAATRSSLSYQEYDELLTKMTLDVNRTLPSFTGHEPGDEKFRTELNAAVRDYKAAKDWWKTTIEYNNTFNETDRSEKLQAKWESAKTHLRNAEQAIASD